MSCTICPNDSKCSHIKRSGFHSMLKSVKGKKSIDEDEEEKDPGQSSSVETGGARPGLIKYLRKCFKSSFNGNSSVKHKSKMRRASSEPVESLSAAAEVSPAAVEDIKQESLKTEDSIEQSQTKSLAVELINLSKYGWYWGPITQAEAVEKLTDQPDGSFLVRDSYADHYLVSMSFRSLGKIYHTRINHSNGCFSFYHSPQHGCASIPELIELSMDSSKSSIFCYSRPRCALSPTLPVRLTRPVSRFTQVRSLQYLCRFVIRQYTRIDQIKDLPLPNSLCGYIEEKQF